MQAFSDCLDETLKVAEIPVIRRRRSVDLHPIEEILRELVETELLSGDLLVVSHHLVEFAKRFCAVFAK